MAYTTIDNPAEYFNTKLYTGTGSSQSITGVGFDPDWVWIKCRSDATTDNVLFDRVRTAGQRLVSNDTGVEETQTGIMSAFVTDGVTLGTGNASNGSGRTYVMWNWLANNTTGSSNTSGSITSTVSANTTSGFSIVSYTGNGSSGATVGHGIGSTVGMILLKGRSFVDNWAVYHKSIGGTGLLELNGTGGTNTISTRWNNTNAGATVFTLGNNSQVNNSGSTYIAYCFSEIKSFSKFGSYTGNGSTDGTFVYTGFKPAMVIMKSSSNTSNWAIWDNKRDDTNVVGKLLLPNTSGAESDLRSSHYPLDFVSNGFKLRTDALTGTTNINISAYTYIYMAFAENPFVSSEGLPCTAR